MGWGRHGACRFCWEEIAPFPRPACGACGRPVPASAGEDHPRLCPAESCPAAGWRRGAHGALAYGPYRGRLRSLIRALKYEGRHSLAAPLGRRLGRALASAAPRRFLEGSALVPVPLSADHLARRGYNQSDLVARAAAWTLRRHRLGVEGPARILRRRPGPPQTGLSRLERLKNPSGRYRVSRRGARRIAGRRVILVDDVLTTGATLGACAAALLEAGAVEVLAAVVARTPSSGTTKGPDSRKRQRRDE